MVKFGFHVSVSKSIDLAVNRAQEDRCESFQIFTRNPRSWAFRKLSDIEIDSFKQKRIQAGIDLVFGHMPYILNLASPEKDTYKRSILSLKTELSRCKSLDIPMLVTHIGSHLGKGPDYGVNRVVLALETALKNDNSDVIILLETGAGSRNSVGSSFEEIGKIIERISETGRVGVCLDTCHVFTAGYELRSLDGLSSTIAKFDKTLGLDRLRLVHLNDSVGDIGSGRDHHEHLGLGKIGLEGLGLVVNSALAKAPMIMETPIDDRRANLENMEVARSLVLSR